MLKSSLLSLATVLAALVVASDGAVLGLDFGTQYLKMALVKVGSFTIVNDEHSKRKSPTVVGFEKDDRAFGNGAKGLVSCVCSLSLSLSLSL
jgi:molecular chaperone DnaK (HSP70)